MDILKNLSPKQRELLMRRLDRASAPETPEERLEDRSGAPGEAPAPEPPPERIPLLPRDADGGGTFPVSFAQERFWFLDRLEPGGTAYNIPAALAMRGSLEIPVLAAALGEIVRRHEALRTTFGLDLLKGDPEGGGPVQRVHPAAPGEQPLPLVDLSGLPREALETSTRESIAAAIDRPFDLEHGPMMRVVLVRTAAAEHVAVLTLHHIASDGWSSGVLVKELGVFYRAFSRREPSPLPLLPCQYADFAVWQRGWLQGETLERTIGFWRRHLAGAAPLELPADRARPPLQTFHGAAVSFTLPADLSAAAGALGRARGATFYMTSLAAYGVLLHRLSGQDDLTVGTPHACRDRREVQDLIGPFINALTLRADLSGAPGFAALVERMRVETLRAFAHREVPFEKVVEELRPERTLSLPPLFQVLFNLTSTGLEELSLPGLTLSPHPYEANTAKLDLTLTLEPQGDVYGATFEYNTALFDRATVERLAGFYLRLLTAAVAEPERRVGELPLLSDAERWQLLEGWNDVDGGATPRPGGRLIHELFAARAAAHPDAPALSQGEEALTYGVLAARANRLAHHLRRLGVGPEVRVALCLERTPDLVVGLLGVLGAGGAYVPLDPGHPAERTGLILADASPAVLVTEERLLAALPPCGARVVCLDRDREAIAAESAQAPERTADEENLAYVIFTSGSTGRPKGVQLPHRAVVSFLLAMARRPGLGAGDVMPALTTITFDIAGLEIYLPLAVGGRVEMVSREEASDGRLLAARLEACGATVAQATPATWRLLLEAGWKGAPGLRALCGGEALPRDLAAALRAKVAELWNVYGPTETAVWSTAGPVEEGSAAVPLGAPLANTRLYTVDRSFELVPVGVAGELWIGGDGVARGYLGRPDLTAERFVPDPWAPEAGARLYRTGDLVRRRGLGIQGTRGALEFLGRIDHQVKVRGYRIEPGEIEAALRRHPAVAQAAVVAREDGGDRRLAAYLVPRGQDEDSVEARDGAEKRPHPQPLSPLPPAPPPGEGRQEAGDAVLFSPLPGKGWVGDGRGAGGEGAPATVFWNISALRSFLAESLPEYMIPAVFVSLSALPLTPSGKVDRKALPSPDRSLAGDALRHVPPSGPVEEVLAAVWAEILQAERIGAEDNFFTLGGHSLLATRIVSRVRAAFGVDIPLRRLFERPTVSGLARAIAETQRSAAASPASPPLLRLPRTGPARLSFAQERLWFLDRLDPGSIAYNLPAALRMTGPLDVAALRAALNEIVRRHESLRTTFVAGFVAGGDGPRQVIAPALEPAVPVVDLGGLPAAARRAEVLAWSAREAWRPFDLARGPLLRVTLLRLADEEWTALFNLHHIVSDAWSLDVLVREIVALYPAFHADRPSPLPELPVQYADYAEWQRAWLADPEALAGQLAWWRERLQGAPAVSPLPTDRPRPPVQRFRGRNVRQELPPETVDALRRLCAREGATLFMGVLSGLFAVLARHSGTADLGDITVGTPVAGRTRVEVEDLIGLFLNTLVLRLPASSSPSETGGFRELLARTRELTLGAFAHQDLPFAKLVEELAPERNLSQTPLFQVQLALLAAEGEPLLLPGLTLDSLHLEESAAKVDLTLRANEGRRGLELVWQFNTDLFDTATIVRLGLHFAALLAAAAAEPDLRLAALSLLTAGEEHQILAEWNDTFQDLWPSERNGLHERIAAQARRTPDRPAVSYEGESLTYAELLAAARRLAHRLRGLGVGPDVPVAVCADRSLEMVVGLLAVLEAGGAYLPLDPAYPADRLAYMLEDAAVPVLLVQERHRGLLSDPTDPSAPTDPSDLTAGPGPAVLLLDGVASPSPPWPLSPIPSQPPGEGGTTHPDSLAYIIYTSGSTGRPKGTMNTHRGIVNRLLWMQDRYGLTPDDRVLQKTPFSFDVSVWEFFWPLLTGARLVIARPGGHQDPAYLVATLAAEGITTLHFVPSMLRVFVDAPGVERCASLRRVMASGEALPPEVARRFHARLTAELHNLYGPTEAAVDVTFHECERDSARTTLPIGRPVANTRILILDHEGSPVPVGVPGELHIGGVQLARGYLARPDLTAERFVPDPLSAYQSEPGARLYRTGDLARLLPDGEVEFLGRIDHQVKLRGLRIELGEIEAALATLPGVRDAVVMTRTGAGSEARLVAYVVGAHVGETLSLDQVRTALARTLPEYMLPDALVALESFPLTPSGKVDRKALPAPEARPETAGEAVPPRTPLEHDLAGLWRDILGTETIGVHDNFFQLGGNSISGAVFINRLQERLGEIVHVVTLFDAPTIARLALHIAAEYPRAVERIWGGETLAAHGGPAFQPARRVDEALLDGVRGLLHRRAAAPEARGEKNPPALFVLSPPRSGSTLLRVMLAGHPRIFAPPELELLHFATLRERRDTFTGRDTFRLEGLPRAVMEARGCDAAEAQALVAAWEEEGMSTRELYRRLQQWIGDRILADKTPTYGWDPEALREAEAAFDRPLYIHLLRHPYGMIRSFEEARVDQVFFPADQPFARRELAEAAWVLAQRNILEHLATVPDDRRLDVRFEDLVRDPDTELRRICAFLGIDYDPDMAEPYRRSSERMTDGLHAESRMLGDVKFHQHSGVDTAAADRWRDQVREDFLGEPARRLAAELGYTLAAGETPAWTAIPRRQQDQPPPLSFSQERMWFLHELDPGSSAYNLCGAVRLRGTLDTAVLERCFAELLRRHESLRTTFGAVDGRPVQIVQPAPSSGSVLSRVDLSSLPAEDREAAAARLAAEEELRPFDLLRGPVCRFSLLRLDEGEHALLLTFHHICSDGWSMVILVRELVTLYRAFITGAPSPLPELPIQYGDFALWQRATLQGDALEAELAWWRRRLAGDLPPLHLPADRRRSSVRGFQSQGAGIALQAEVVRGLHELSRRGSASLYMTLLAAWKGLLSRLTGEADVLVGAPTANRTRPEVEGLIGFFLNTLVLRTDLSGAPTFREALARVRETTLGAFAHQAVPLQTVLQAAQPNREWAQTTPFQVMFLLQNLPPQESSAPGLTFSPLEADRTIQDLGTAIFEIGLTLDESAAGLSASITYNGLLFDEATVAGFLERYHRLLAAVVADPAQPLWSYDLMSAAERSEVLAWGSTMPEGRAGSAASGLVPVHRAFAKRAAADPEAPAVLSGTAGGPVLTYGDLDRRANRAARYLRTLGVGPETVVGVAIDRSPELIVALLAVLKAGGAYVPLDPAYPGERLAYILDDAGAAAVLTTSTVTAMHPVLAAGGRRAVLLDTEAPALAAQPGTPPDVDVDPDHLAYLIYTSGSTGRPKGVMIRHGSLAAYVAGFRGEHGLGPADRVLQFASISFDTSAEEIYPCLTGGAALVLRDDTLLGSAPDFLRACGALGISILDLPTAFWHEMVARLEEEPAGSQAIPASLRLVILGGERALPERLAAWHALGTGGIRLLNTYGPTEATIVATRCELPPGLAIPGEVPIGRPVPGGRAFVADPDLELVPPGVPGELCLGGAGLARGYLGRPDLTAERFLPDPWSGEPGARLYHTGDLVRLLSSRDLEFLGRVDDQVKIRGFRVELREIEAALSRHPEIAEAVVTAREGAPGDRRLAAYAVARDPAAPPTPSDLRAFLKESLPDYMVPAAFVFLPAFPLTPSGKVDRRSLPEPDRQRPGGDRDYVPPGTPAEETVAAIWTKVLGLDRVSVTDNFFELGGHSLLLPQVLYHLRSAFQIDVPLRKLFAEPTVEGLALVVEELVLAEIEAEIEQGED